MLNLGIQGGYALKKQAQTFLHMCFPKEKVEGAPKPTSKRNLPIFVVHDHICLRGLPGQYDVKYHNWNVQID